MAGLILYGALRDLDDGERAGVALAVQVPTREALDGLLGNGLAGPADDGEVGIHDWEMAAVGDLGEMPGEVTMPAVWGSLRIAV